MYRYRTVHTVPVPVPVPGTIAIPIEFEFTFVAKKECALDDISSFFEMTYVDLMHIVLKM